MELTIKRKQNNKIILKEWSTDLIELTQEEFYELNNICLNKFESIFYFFFYILIFKRNYYKTNKKKKITSKTYFYFTF